MEEMKAVVVTYNNKELEKITNQIRKLSGEIKSNLFRISALIADVSERELYLSEGFENVHEWTSEAFGLRKSASYKFLKIGKEYTQVVTDNKRRIYKSNLTPANAIDDYNTTQIERLMPLGKEKIEELIANKEINPGMSVREIKEVVNRYKNEDKENDVYDGDINDNSVDTDSDNNTDGDSDNESMIDVEEHAEEIDEEAEKEIFDKNNDSITDVKMDIDNKLYLLWNYLADKDNNNNNILKEYAITKFFTLLISNMDVNEAVNFNLKIIDNNLNIIDFMESVPTDVELKM